MLESLLQKREEWCRTVHAFKVHLKYSQEETDIQHFIFFAVSEAIPGERLNLTGSNAKPCGGGGEAPHVAFV